VLNWELDKIYKYSVIAPNAEKAVPRPEHLAPLIVMMGTSTKSKKVTLLNNTNGEENIYLSCYMFE
jgi:4,5-DOPA dioxygenase extradiol